MSTTSNQIISIQGWHLNNPSRELFNLEDTDEEMGNCISDTCMHYSHSERGSVNRLVLKEGNLELIGTVQESPADQRDPMNEIEYYKILVPGEHGYANILRVVDECHYGRTASILNRISQSEQYNAAHMDIIAAEKEQREEEEQERNRPVLTQEQRAETRQKSQEQVAAIRAREPRKSRGPRVNHKSSQVSTPME